MTYKQIKDSFMTAVNNNELKYNEGDFDCFVSNLHQDGKITDRQYNLLTFEEVYQ